MIAYLLTFRGRMCKLGGVANECSGKIEVKILRSVGIALTVIASGLALSAGAQAQSLPELLEKLVTTHDRIKQAKNDLEAAESNIEVSKGAWYPELDLTQDLGFQKRHNPGTQDTTKNFTDTSATITQKLWDFGKTNSDIGISKKRRDSSFVSLTQTRQDLILDAIAAYIQVYSASKRVALAKKSEENIKKQTELEDARVAGGAGFSTDVLQAKTELAEAQTRRVVAEGSLRNALSRYHSLFREFPRAINEFKLPPAPKPLMPDTLEQAIEIGLKENPKLRIDNIASDIAKSTLVRTRQDLFFPEINAVLESKHQNDVDGSGGHRNDQIAKVEISFPFNLGGSAFDEIKASRSSHLSSVNRVGDTRRDIEEQVRLAWADLETQNQNNDVRTAQIEIAQRFLELAREEREAGRRSLLDVLSGETRLINAQSDAVLTEVAIIQASFRLLKAIGRLEISAVE